MLSMGGLVLMKKVRRGVEALYRWFCFFYTRVFVIYIFFKKMGLLSGVLMF